MSEDIFRLPDDLSGVSNDELAELHQQATAAFDTLYEGGASVGNLARATELADAIETITGEHSRRSQAVEQFAAQRSRVDALRQPKPSDEPAPEPDPDPEPEPEIVPKADGQPAMVADARPRTDVHDVLKDRPSINPSLADASRRAPDPNVPARQEELVITASSPTAGAPIGSRFASLQDLTRAVQAAAKGTSISTTRDADRDWRLVSHAPLASIQNSHPVTLGWDTPPDAVERAWKELTANPEQVLTAAGGWCAPSEIRYDFFNIACESGMIDLPTIGIERGGIRYPVSPSLADVFSPVVAPFGGDLSNATVPWLWTEGDDILAATGDPTKPCIRVPCSSFSETRWEAYGICLTAGNLTDAAYPEATTNFMRLLMSAFYRAKSTRYINTMVNLSTLCSPATGIGAGGAGMTAPLLGTVEMAAIDYRARYGMCDMDILEVVLPYWAKGAVRSDLAKRNGLALFDVTDDMIARWFDVRRVRVQFISDWQVRASGYPGYSTAMTAWPTQVQFLIYAPGTFVLGNGPSLDLGVIRDSTLNAANDHTAAWMEETHLIAMFGHRSCRYIVNVCTDGTTGAADLTACAP